MSTLDRPELVPFETVLPPGQLTEGQLPRPTDVPVTRGESPGVALAAARVPGSPTLPDPASPAFATFLSQLGSELFSGGSAPFASALPGQLGAPGAEALGHPGSVPSPSLGGGPPTAPLAPSFPAEPSGSASDLAGPALAVGAPAGSVSPGIVPSGSASPGSAPSSVPTSTGGAWTGAPVGGVPEGTPAAVSPFSAPLDFGSLDALDAVPLASYALVGEPAAEETPVLPAVDASGPYWLGSERPTEPASNGLSPASPSPIHLDAFQIEPAVGPGLGSSSGIFDPHAVRREFPILNERVNGKRLVWLDNAATTQKPRAVIDRLTYFYEHENSNIHRAAHTLAARATDAYENARETVRRFIGAPSKDNIVFVRGATEGINLVAQSWGRQNVREGDEILLTNLEHHANIVPWQQLAREKGAKLRVAPVDSQGSILLEEYERLLSDRTRIVAFTQVSNALGTITPAAEMIALAHRHGARVLLDGAQGVSHTPVDVQGLDCDFYVFSGHKVFAPTGIGVVFGKKDVLEAMPPWQGGGNMIQDVTFERTLYHGPPARFEAGTGNIADAVGLGAALDWLSRIGIHNVERYEHDLLVYATERLLAVPGLRLIGTSPHKAGVLSFVLSGQKTEQVGGLLDQEGIAVRSGHHCAQPILRRFGLEATVRASLAPYNTTEDIDALVSALYRLQAGQLAS